jgi:NAD(P)-dependent dehydrogenase (short-subunit alcohol dehydrogenase family)
MGGARPGVIITLSEPGAKLPVGGILGHAVSSAGKEVFSRLLAAEPAPRDIRVMCMRPHALADGPAYGSSTKEVFEPAATALGQSVEEWMAGLADSTMLKRLPTASDGAETAAFLASDRAGAMTGTVANLTGGALADC